MSPTQPSDKGIGPLAKQIRSILLPGGEVEDAHRLNLESNLPLSVLEHAIKMLMTRTNYGLDAPLGQRLPAAVCVWRWEVQDAYKDWLPKSARENADARLAERTQVTHGLFLVQVNFLTVNRQVRTCVRPLRVFPRSKETPFSTQRAPPSFLRRISTNLSRVLPLQAIMKVLWTIMRQKTHLRPWLRAKW